MVRPIPGRKTFQQLAGPMLRRAARRGLRGLGDVLLGNSLQQLAANAGFTGDDAATAAAIAMAESSGNPRIYNPETKATGGTPTGKGSYGLWQIYLRDHPEFAGWDLYDPQTNANAAFRVYQKQGWAAWTTYKTGAYRAYLPAAAAPEEMPAPPPTFTVDPATGQVIDEVPAEASVISAAPNALLLTALAAGAYLIADTLFGD